ncbi:TPA: HD domain-containing protein [Vibrio vulnificus]|nr:HD domain-containing protein [Vibrio vulnificus]
MNYGECRITSSVFGDNEVVMPQCKRQIHERQLFKDSSLDRAMDDKLFNDSFFKSIIDTKEFQRLKSVSFLGAIDYTDRKNKSTRYIHSLDVAKLALYISEVRNYSTEVTNHLVAAALLHDVGHAPLSHSMEPSFFDEFGIDHHCATTQIISKGKGASSLTETLKAKIDLNLVIDLIEQRSNEEFSDIFNSKINVDTIDGIHKSLSFVKIHDFYDKYDLVNHVFLSNTENSIDCVKKIDNFWKAKDFVYKNVISSGIGAIADHVSREYFNDNLKKIDESYFFKTESAFLMGCKPLFKNFTKHLNSITDLSGTSVCNAQTLTVKVIEREYKPNTNVNIDNFSDVGSFIAERYEVNKREKIKIIPYATSINFEQIELLG